MRKFVHRLVASLALVACSGDNSSAPKVDLSTAYLTASSTQPVAGSVVTMTIHNGPTDPALGSFAARVFLPAGVSFVAERASEGLAASRMSADTLLIAAAHSSAFGEALYAFDVRVDVPENLSGVRLQMIEATAIHGSALAAGPEIAAAASTPVWGDISFDGNITAVDAQGILSASLSNSVTSTYQIPLGDANCDGVLSATDAQVVLAKAVGSTVTQFCVGTAAVVVLYGEIRDAVSFTALAGVKLTLNQTGADAAISLPREAATDGTGAYVFYNNIPNGTYSLVASKGGYQSGIAKAVVIDKLAPQSVEATLTSAAFTSTTFGSVAGRVIDSTGSPVAGATVQLSGGIQTNGAFKATTSAADGSYSFAGVTMTDELKVPIQAFTISARSLTGATGSKTGTIVANEIKTGVNINVAASSTTPIKYFEEGFENGIPSTWTATGIWSARGTTAVTNKAFPNYVKMAPNDFSLGAVPLPATGIGAAWAGSATTGNFIGTQVAGDFPLNGGTGTDDTEGLLTSPAITVPLSASHMTLYFDAWFEIESVNPNASGYDIMEIDVLNLADSSVTSLTRLNPFEDPPLTNRSAIPFTSGGFNRRPVWRPVYFNLDAFRGQTIKLGFCFRTEDHLYNGFRGWLIDNVRLTDEVAAGVSAGPMTRAEAARVGEGRNSVGGSSGNDVAKGFVFGCMGTARELGVAFVTLTPPSLSLKITETAQLFATPFDSTGSGLAGRFVIWSSSNSSVASVSNSGVVTAKSTGTATITAEVEGVDATATVTVGNPTSTMGLHAGNDQSQIVGIALPILPSIRILSATGQPVSGASVTFAVDSGGGTITGASTTTNANGIATVGSWVLGATAGTNTLKVSSPAVTNGPLIFTATGISSGLNLSIENLYVTQATQTMANDVPLVAGRPALIRIFVKATQANTAKPTVRVRTFKGSTLVKTYTVTSAQTTVPTNIGEATLGSTWNLAIPADEMETGLSVLADVDPDTAITETVETDNSWPKSGSPKSLNVRTVPRFDVTFVPVTQPGNVTAGVSDANKDAFMDFARRVYPIASYDALVHAPFSYGKILSSGYDATWTDLLLQIKALRVAELPAPGNSRNYYGVIHPTYVSGATGLAYVGDPAAVGIDLTTANTSAASDLRAITAAHEWGHNFNRRHVDCGGPANVDATYPYAGTSIGAYGYDVFRNTLQPTSRVDLMSYCTVQWISDYTYKAVLEYRGSTGGVMTTAAAAARSTRGLLVWGQVGPDGIRLEPSFEVDARPSLPATAGPNSVQALDASGNVIFNLSFGGDEIDHLPGVRQFAYVVPLPETGASPAALRLRANGREILNRASAAGASPSAGPASMPRLSRVGARSRLQWNAAEHPMAMVRDAATGQIISFARGGSADIVTPRADVEVILSNGVTSAKRASLRVPQR
jgi:hypothetical protein